MINAQAGLVITLFAALVSSAGAQGILIPSPNRRSHVFDPSGSIFYYTAFDGNLYRYSLSGRTELPAIPFGMRLNDLDITPNGELLYVTDWNDVAAPLHQLDVATGTVSTITQAAEGGTWHVRLVSDSTGFFTSNVNGGGSGNEPMRQINTATNTVSIRPNVAHWDEQSVLIRSADRSRMLQVDPSGSTSYLRDYDTASDTFGPQWQINQFLNGSPIALSRDGSLFAIGLDQPGVTYVYDPDLVLMATLPQSEGLVFDPVRDLLYLANAITDQIVVYRTTNWSVASSFPIGENLDFHQHLGRGIMSMSDDGSWLALSTPAGIRLYNVPAPGAIGLVVGMGGLCVMRRQRRFGS